MNPARTTAWRCGDCREWHEYEDDAISCCALLPDEVTSWKCTECGHISEDEDTARYCCLDEDVVLPATPAQLEAAGQQRLAI